MLREDFPWTGRSRRSPQPLCRLLPWAPVRARSLALDLVEEFRHGLVDSDETRLGSAITDLSGQATPWRGLVHQQAEAMRQAILRGSEYRPFVVE